MDENLGQAMIDARLKALETIAVDLISAKFANEGYPKTDEECRVCLEHAINSLAPGCGAGL